MTIVVTGACSFIGKELIRLCRGRGLPVVGIDAVADESSGYRRIDIRSPDLAAALPEGADALVHLAALSRDQDCRDRAAACFDVNVLGTINLIEAAKARGVKHFIFASSEWVYDSFEPGIEKSEEDAINAVKITSEYALSKYVSESNLRQKVAHGFCPVSVVRLGIVYGARTANWSAVENVANAVATQDDIRVGALATARRFIHVTDVAEGIMATFAQPLPYEIYNIQGPTLVSLGEVIEQTAQLLGRRPRVEETSPATPSVRSVSSGKAAAMLGWNARIGIREGIADFLRAVGHMHAEGRMTAAQG